ncbi:hypothetical protein AAHB56_16840, partial [Bacillus thuringiensis]
MLRSVPLNESGCFNLQNKASYIIFIFIVETLRVFVRRFIEGTQRFISIREDDLNARFPGLLNVVTHATEPY